MESGDCKEVTRLLYYGAGPDIKNLYGDTPYDVAEANYNTEIAGIIKTCQNRKQALIECKLLPEIAVYIAAYPYRVCLIHKK